jgi:hypothetical protein
MDVNGHYEQRRQHYQSLLREAEEVRLARELGLTRAGARRSLGTGLWGALLRVFSPKTIRSGSTVTQRARYSDQ